MNPAHRVGGVEEVSVQANVADRLVELILQTKVGRVSIWLNTFVLVSVEIKTQFALGAGQLFSGCGDIFINIAVLDTRLTTGESQGEGLFTNFTFVLTGMESQTGEHVQTRDSVFAFVPIQVIVIGAPGTGVLVDGVFLTVLDNFTSQANRRIISHKVVVVFAE
jgi:hypothetical protein